MGKDFDWISVENVLFRMGCVINALHAIQCAMDAGMEEEVSFSEGVFCVYSYISELHGQLEALVRDYIGAKK